MTLEERLLARFCTVHPSEAAGLLGRVPAPEAAAALEQLPGEAAVAVLLGMAPLPAAGVLEALETGAAARLLGAAPPARAAGLLRRLRAGTRERLLGTMPGGGRLRPLVSYPEGAAGALMDPLVPALGLDLDIAEVRRRLGGLAKHLALELYVVDADQRLLGVADLREVLDDRRGGTLGSLMRPVAPLAAGTDTPGIEAHPGWSELGSLPVVDEQGTYLGAVRHVRLRQAVRETVSRRALARLEAVEALGELYRLGLGGVFTGLIRVPKERRPG